VTPIGPFRPTQLLGRGGVGEVWRAEHVVSAEAVALKVLSAGHAPAWRELLRREIEAVARLDHPGIVWIHDHGEDPVRGTWIALELATGGTLADHVLRPLPGGWSDVRTVLTELLGALAHAHARGVLHRDLKPQNVLVCTLDDARPGLKLADFSLARLGGGRAASGGSPAYVAPEQAAGDRAGEGPWTDLYGLGAVTWALVTGEPPPGGWTPRFEVPDGLRRWLDHLLAPAPADRFPSAARAAAELALLPRLRDTSRPSFTFDQPTAREERAHPRRTAASVGLFGLRPAPTVGRHSEQAALQKLVRAAVEGRGPAVARVVGERGIGRTHLLRWLEAQVRETDRAVVVNVPASGEVRVAWRTAATTPGLAVDPRARAFLDGQHDDGLALLARWAPGRPVLVLTDDVIAGSRLDRWLRGLARDGHPHLAVVATARTDRGDEGDLVLQRLTEPERLIRALGVVDPVAAVALGRRSGGLPVAALALVRELVRSGRLTAGPEGFVPAGDALDVGSAPAMQPQDHAVLEVLAACGPLATSASWADACGRAGVPFSPEHAEALRRAGLVDGDAQPRIREQLLGEQLRAELFAGRRTDVTAAVAEAVAAADLPDSEVRDEHLGRLALAAGRTRDGIELLFRGYSRQGISDRLDLVEATAASILSALATLDPDPRLHEIGWMTRYLQAVCWLNHGLVARSLDWALNPPPPPPGMEWRGDYHLARSWLWSGSPHRALGPARRAARSAPEGKRPPALGLVGRALIELGRHQEAIALLEPYTGSDVCAGELSAAYLLAGDPARALAVHPEGSFHVVPRAVTEFALRHSRGEDVFDELRALRTSAACATSPISRPAVSSLSALVAAVHRPDRLAEAEAQARTDLAEIGTRERQCWVWLLEAASLAPPALAERLLDLAARQEPEDGPSDG
jgi:hypothetical protein